MNKALIALYSVLGLIVVLGIITALVIVSSHTEAVRLKNDAEDKFDEIGIRLEARYDTMHPIIESIHDANDEVENLLDMITSARTAMLSASTPDELSDAEGDLESAFQGLIVIIEDNPDTYTTIALYNQYISLATASTNAVTYARTQYNDAVYTYRTHVETFPGVLFLGMFGFTADRYQSYQAPTVEIPTF